MQLEGPAGRLLLVLGSTLLALLAIETGLRVHAHLASPTGLEDLGGNPPPLRDEPVQLGHRLRPVANPRIIYRLIPNLFVRYMGVQVRTDNQGFRGGKNDFVPNALTSRIVGLGDSFMFGYGVADDECYLAVMEQRLQRASDTSVSPGSFTSRNWQVINTAVPGYNTAMEVEFLKQNAIAYEPAIVIIGFVVNDLALPNFIRARESALSLERSFLADRVRQRLSGRWKTAEPPIVPPGLTAAPEDANWPGEFEHDPDKVPARYRSLVGWKSYSDSLIELERMRVRHGFEVIWLSLWPYRSAIVDRASELGFHILDLGPGLADQWREGGYDSYLASPLALSRSDAHPSALTHGIAAEELFMYLDSHRLLEPRSSASPL